tara:strand:- start:1430 stop:2371 length:942 start_codon:yes stop_codon:yes gene_type:complete
MIKLDEIESAHRRIKPFVHRTMILTNKSIDALTGAHLFFKCENFQKTGSFKIRGATNAILQLSQEDISRGIATASSGNHGAALSRAVSIKGGTTKVVMPTNTPKIKVDNVIRNGGEVLWCEPTQSSRDYVLQKLLDDTGSKLIHPYNDDQIITGQATVAKELYEDCLDLEIIISPVSGGGLLAGSLSYLKKINPEIVVYGAEPEKADDTYRSITVGKIQSNITTNTICDGLRAQVGTITFPIIQQYVNGIIVLSEKEIIDAMKIIWERLKIIIEPSCSITLAAILKRKDLFINKRVGLILSGGNVDLSKMPWQ